MKEETREEYSKSRNRTFGNLNYKKKINEGFQNANLRPWLRNLGKCSEKIEQMRTNMRNQSQSKSPAILMTQFWKGAKQKVEGINLQNQLKEMSQSYREWPSRVKESSLKCSSTKYSSRLTSNNTPKISENEDDINLQRASREKNTVFSEESRVGVALNLNRAMLLLTMEQVFQDYKGKWFTSKCSTPHLIPAQCEGKLTLSRSVMSQKTLPCSLPQESTGRVVQIRTWAQKD